MTQNGGFAIIVVRLTILVMTVKKKVILRRSAMAVAVSTVFFLTACGGGGGGGGGSYVRPNTPASLYSSAVPYSTPTNIESINPLVGVVGYAYAMTTSYTADLTGTGTENIIVAGSQSHSNNLTGPADAANWKNSQITILGWSGSTLTDQTNTWFTPGDNTIVGATAVKFGNFNGNGRQNMFVGNGTDGILDTTQAQIFVNTGGHFTRYNINLPYSLDTTDAAVFNYNGVDNIFAVQGSSNSTFIFGSNVNNFRAYTVNSNMGSANAVAAGNFTGNGQTTFILGDNGVNALGTSSTRLYSWTINNGTNSVDLTLLSTLPTPIFNQPAYFGITGGNNTIRILKFDFDESGVDSAVVVGMGNDLSASVKSSIQFLKNNGAGTFTDITNSTVTGYDMTKAASANPVVVDLLNNGLADIVLPTATNTQILMQVSKGQYVASFANVLTDFQNQIGSTNTGAINFVKGPGGNLYLLDTVDTTAGSTATKTFYLSQIGNSAGALNATQTISAIKQLWPWMTDASANAVLAATGKTWFGATIIDDSAVWLPYGSLSVATAKGLTPVQGYIAGVELSTGDGQITAMDTLGRSFNVNLSGMRNTTYANSFNMNSEHIDQYELTSHSEYLINGAVNTYNGIRIGSEDRNIGNTLTMDSKLGPTLGAAPKNYTVGLPAYWRSNSGRWSAGAQYTTLNYNPWLAFGGAWGQVTQTGNLDHAVRYVNENGFTAVAGTTYTTTTITPGLITSVAPIAGAWGEAGYKSGNFGVYAGVKPILFSGNVTANLPTSVDNTGNIVYTRKNLAIQNQTTGYARALWNTDIQKNVTYRISGAVMTNGQYRLMNELRIFF